MTPVIKKLCNTGIIPVIVSETAEKSEQLASALTAGDISCAEITLRTDAAFDIIRKITSSDPDFLIGAGTVLTPEQADLAVKAGAKFLVSPGLEINLCRYCADKGYLLIPGISTASELQTAYSLGLRYVKFFPAEACGGVKMLKSLSAPFASMNFMPTGGIEPENLGDYLSLPSVFACGGSYIASKKLIENGDFEKITESAKLSREIFISVRGDLQK